MFRTCKVKLGKAPKQEEKLAVALELCRELYNAALQQRKEAWDKQKLSLSYYDQCKELTQLRADDEIYRNLPSNLVRITVLERLDKAYKRAFGRLKRGEKPGFPRYRGVGRFTSLLFDKKHWKIDGKKIIFTFGQDKIPLRMKNSIFFSGEIVRLSLVKKADRWWAHFLLDVGEAPVVSSSKKGVGIDVGIKTFATLSDGEKIEHPHFLKQVKGQIKEAQSILRKKKKGSNNYFKARDRFTRLNSKLANRRRNFIYQTVASLLKIYDGFAVEDLWVEDLLSTKRNIPSGMNQHSFREMHTNMMDSSWSSFSTHLENKAEEAGYPFVRIDPKGTSQQCSDCGTFVRKSIGDRMHECPACGLSLGRDENAARNIANAANDLGWRSVSGDTVRVDGIESTEMPKALHPQPVFRSSTSNETRGDK